MARKEAKPDLRNGMWERGPVKVDENQDRAQQDRANIDPDIPRYVRPGFNTQSPGQTTHQ
jgi:hypothetical protein